MSVAYEQLKDILKLAQILKVKGLTEAETAVSPPPAISTSTTSSACQSSGQVSPPHSTNVYHPYGHSPVDQTRIPVSATWPLIGIPMAHHATSGHQPSLPIQHSILGGSYNSGSETTSLRKKKYSSLMVGRGEQMPILRTVLGQGNADSSQGVPTAHADHQESFRSHSNGSSNDNDRRNSAEMSHGDVTHSTYDSFIEDEDKQRISPPSYTPSGKSGN